MVVIVIVVTLASIVFVFVGKAKTTAQSVDAINRIRQSGSYLLGTAQDNHGRLKIFVHGSQTYDHCLRDMLEYGEGWSRDEIYKIIISPAYYEAGLKGAKMDRWHAWGTNSENAPGIGVVWQ